MTDQTISFTFFLLLAILSIGLFITANWSRALVPNDKCHIFLTVGCIVSGLLAGAFLYYSGFYVDIGFK
jgi:uncharacterized membrane protein